MQHTDFLERVHENMARVKSRAISLCATRSQEGKPLRIVETEGGQVLLVEWLCPACLGKPGWKGCRPCKSMGCMDGITKAIYDESHCSD